MGVSLIEQIIINYSDRYQNNTTDLLACEITGWKLRMTSKIQGTYMYRQWLSWSMLERRNKRGLSTDSKELKQRKACNTTGMYLPGKSSIAAHEV